MKKNDNWKINLKPISIAINHEQKYVVWDFTLYHINQYLISYAMHVSEAHTAALWWIVGLSRVTKPAGGPISEKRGAHHLTST